MTSSDQRPRDHLRTYDRRTSVVFCKTQEAFGGLSNMAAGYPVMVNGVDIRTSEALYQACRFPHRLDVQRLIIAERSPMTAKMKSKPHRHDTRPDWDAVRVGIMRWCLRVKLAQNWRQFGELLRSTGERPIVEESRKDDYWGAKVVDPGTLVGMNVLGRLLMELREELKSVTGEQLQHVEPPRIPDFQLYGQPIGVIARNGVPAREPDMSRHPLLDTANLREAPAAANMAASPPPVVTAAAAPELKPTMKEGSDGVIPKECKRLAEVDFPIAIVSKHSAREKTIRHGHPSTLHLWWARRPLAACRAVLMALLLPDPADPNCPAEFKRTARRVLLAHPMRPARWDTEIKTDEGLRHVLLAFIGDFADWDNAASASYLKAARELVKAAHPEDTPLVVDPFAGGGSIPLEALRLSCDSFASDLNPVACLINKVLLEDIPRQGERLAEELRRVGAEIKAAAEAQLASFYPVDSDGARPIAYLWARTVLCEQPGCGCEIPLARSFWLCNKSSRRRALRYEVKRPRGKPPRVEFEVYEPASEKDIQPGTVNRAKAACPACGGVLAPVRVRAQLRERRGGARDARLMTVVTTRRDVGGGGMGEGGRFYRTPTEADLRAAKAAEQELARRVAATPDIVSGLSMVPNEPTPRGGGSGAGRAFSQRNYGMDIFADLFTPRQLLALTTLAQLVREAGERLRAGGSVAVTPSTKLLRGGGTAAGEGITPALAEAVQTALALCIGRTSNQFASLCKWNSGRELVDGVFARQALPILWDFGEIAFGDGGYFEGAVEWVSAVVEANTHGAPPGAAQQASATAHPLPDDTVATLFTDPPYYDAVPYADLSDYFYVWLKRAMPPSRLAAFADQLAPKDDECIVDEIKGKDRAYFEKTMGEAMAEGRRILKPDGIGCVVFAHKTTEGWEALLGGMIAAGWTITASWPITTEMASRLRARESAALAASIHLVCRPRPEDAPIGDWQDVLRELPRRVADWMERLQGEGVRGADLVFACIGPALEVYSRYAKVVDPMERTIPLGGNPEAKDPHQRGYLAYVWEVVGRAALNQVLGTAEAGARNGAAGALEEDARLTALFLWTMQATASQLNGEDAEGAEDETDEGDAEEAGGGSGKAKKGLSLVYDVARRFAQPLGIHMEAWEGRIIETDKGVVRLLPVLERAEQLFGEDGASGVADRLEKSGTASVTQGLLFPQQEEAPRVRGARRGRADVPDESMRTRREATTLDRVHAAMLLQASGRANALRALLTAEVDRGPDFLRLANALSALYPAGSDEKRLVDAMLLAVPR